MLTNFETNKVFIAKGLSSVPYSSTAYSLVTSLYKKYLEKRNIIIDMRLFLI